MQITRQADYGIRAVRYLARQRTGHLVATSTVAREMQIPPSFLAKIISQLSISGLIRTSRGAHGGVSLARPSKDISVLEVVEAIDGPIHLDGCGGSAGNHRNGSLIHPIWEEVQESLVTRLRDTRFNATYK
jgi:Rrf2 family protein